MICAGCQKRDNKNSLLARQIAILQQGNRKLSRKLEELLKHKTMLAGMKGERLILDITKGAATKPGAPHDIRLPDGGKVEVKRSGITKPNGTSCQRWVWGGLFGERKAKDYDYVVLIGEKDGNIHVFEEDRSDFVFFILTKTNLKKLALARNKRGWIALNINPNTGWSLSKSLWKYRVPANEAKKFFKRLRIARNSNEVVPRRPLRGV